MNEKSVPYGSTINVISIGEYIGEITQSIISEVFEVIKNNEVGRAIAAREKRKKAAIKG